MLLRWILPGYLILLLHSTAAGQSPNHLLAQDTIITREGFLSDIYLLDGKRLNLEVMEFFMADQPSAYQQIRAANLTDQLSLAGYSIGSIMMLSGILFSEDNPRLSRDLYFYGGIGLGSGIVFQVISHSYQKEAVYLYNEAIKAAYYRKSSVDLHWEIGQGKMGLFMRF